MLVVSGEQGVHPYQHQHSHPSRTHPAAADDDMEYVGGRRVMAHTAARTAAVSCAPSEHEIGHQGVTQVTRVAKGAEGAGFGEHPREIKSGEHFVDLEYLQSWRAPENAASRAEEHAHATVGNGEGVGGEERGVETGAPVLKMAVPWEDNDAHPYICDSHDVGGDSGESAGVCGRMHGVVVALG